jgi:hypothetical protein
MTCWIDGWFEEEVVRWNRDWASSKMLMSWSRWMGLGMPGGLGVPAGCQCDQRV